MPGLSAAEERSGFRERRARFRGRVDGSGSAAEETELHGLRTRRGARAALRSFRRGEASEQAFLPVAIGILLPRATSAANAVGYAGPLVRRSVQYAT